MTAQQEEKGRQSSFEEGKVRGGKGREGSFASPAHVIGKDTCFYKVASGGRGSGSALSATSMYFRERPSWTTSMEQHTDDDAKTNVDVSI